MSFTLSVQFTGLCLHVLHPDGKQVAVLMPDARFDSPAFQQARSDASDEATSAAGDDGFAGEEIVQRTHIDGTDAVPHVGYLRADLACVRFANAKALLPTETLPVNATDDGPPFEIVYRFRGQTLDFGLPATTSNIGVATGLPEFTRIVPGATVIPDVFTRAPKTPLLFRTLLQGGRLAPRKSTLHNDMWSIAGTLNKTNPLPFVDRFQGDVIWDREVDADGLTIMITDFDGRNPIRLPLVPVETQAGPTIALKIANLCSDNPLEWNQFPIRRIPDEDSDFKWLYTLLQPPASWPSLLDEFVLPAPRLVSRRPERHGTSGGDCVGGSITGISFAPLAQWSK